MAEDKEINQNEMQSLKKRYDSLSNEQSALLRMKLELIIIL